MKILAVALIALVLALSPVEKQLVIVIEEIADNTFNTLTALGSFDITASEETIFDHYKILYDITCKVDENLSVHARLPSNFQLSLVALCPVYNISGRW